MSFKMGFLPTKGVEVMSRSNLSKLKIQVVRCMKLIDKYDYRIEQMKKRQEVLRSTLLTFRAQIETKEALDNALLTN